MFLGFIGGYLRAYGVCHTRLPQLFSFGPRYEPSLIPTAVYSYALLALPRISGSLGRALLYSPINYTPCNCISPRLAELLTTQTASALASLRTTRSSRRACTLLLTESIVFRLPHWLRGLSLSYTQLANMVKPYSRAPVTLAPLSQLASSICITCLMLPHQELRRVTSYYISNPHLAPRGQGQRRPPSSRHPQSRPFAGAKLRRIFDICNTFHEIKCILA